MEYSNNSKCMGGIDHKYRYVAILGGRGIYACWTCGNTEFPFEESYGG